MDWSNGGNQGSETVKEIMFPVGSASREIHVITIVDDTGNQFTDSALSIGVANLIGRRAVREGRGKHYSIDSFRIEIFGYGILWREFVRKDKGK